MKLVKTKKKVYAKNSVGFGPKAMEDQKIKRSSPKILWVFGSKVSEDQTKEGFRRKLCGFSLRMRIETQ